MTADRPPIAALFDYTDRTLRAGGTPGAAVVIAARHGVVACKGFGVDGDRQPMSCDSPMIIASLTKGFTAIAAMQLARSGKIQLDAPVQRYLPWFHVADAEASARITVRDLLNQRSGFSESSGRAWLASRPSGDDVVERRVRALARERLSSSPGTRFEYSNANYDVLGAVIASISGLHYKDYIQSNVLKPLGITHAAFTCENDPHGYARIFSFPVSAGNQPELCGDAAAGGLTMSAREYGRYLAANVDAGNGWSSVVLDRVGWQTLQHSPTDLPYAMGWSESFRADGTRELRHDGAAPDFHSFAALLPSRGIAAARLSNANEMPDGGRSDAVDRGFLQTLEGRAVDAQPLIPPDIYLRLVVLGATLLSLRSLRPARTTLHNGLIAAGNFIGVAAIAWFVLPQWGWSLGVGFAYAPDLTALIVMLAVVLIWGGCAAVYAAVAQLRSR